MPHRQNLVLLHGHGMDDTLWDALIPLTEEDFRIITPNLSLPSNLTSMDAYADELHRLVSASGITRFTLIGHSMGGYAALAFAEKYPDMLEGFGLFHSSALADTEEKKQKRDQMIRLIRTKGAEAFIDLTLPALFGGRYRENYPGEVEKYRQRYGKLPARALAAGMSAMRDRPDRTHVLKSMPYPVLFVVGMHDEAVPFESVMEQVRFADVTYPFVLAEAGHLGMVERPEASARIIRWYMAQIK